MTDHEGWIKLTEVRLARWLNDDGQEVVTMSQDQEHSSTNVELLGLLTFGIQTVWSHRSAPPFKGYGED